MDSLLNKRIDIRCITITVIIVILLLFYVLISRYDESLFNPAHLSFANDFNIFISPNMPSIYKASVQSISDSMKSAQIGDANINPPIPLSITDRSDIPYVVVGYCCQLRYNFHIQSLINLHIISNI